MIEDLASRENVLHTSINVAYYWTVFFTTHSYTSVAFGRKKAASEKAAADEAAAVAHRKKARAEEKEVKGALAEKLKKARLAKQAAKAKEREAADADARRAARLEKKAAKGMLAAPQAALAGKRGRRANEQVEFGPPKKKRAGKYAIKFFF
jgi:hypothetical protein